jgi:hypothetical protein
VEVLGPGSKQDEVPGKLCERSVGAMQKLYRSSAEALQKLCRSSAVLLIELLISFQIELLLIELFIAPRWHQLWLLWIE